MSLLITVENSKSQIIAVLKGLKYKLDTIECYSDSNDFSGLPSKIKNNLAPNIGNVMVAYVTNYGEVQDITIKDQMNSVDSEGDCDGLVVAFYDLDGETYTVASQPTNGDVKLGGS